MAKKCASLLRNCPQCKKRFQNNRSQESCPDCGADLHCDKFSVPGYNYCPNHGGPAPARNFFGLGRGMTTGKGSAFPLTQIASKYNEMQSNGKILSNRKSMDILWHRVEELAERIDLNQAPERMATIQKLWIEFRTLSAQGKDMEAVVMARKIDAEFEAAYHDYMAWKQMIEILEVHSKMTESEVKIMKDLRMIMTAEDAYELVAQVMAVMLRVLQDDPKKLKEAQYELTRLIGETGGRFGRSRGESRVGAGSSDMDRERVFDTGDSERSETAGADAIGPVSEGRDQGDILP